MAKFCTKCGKPLVEGEVCSCSNNIVNEYISPVENKVEENINNTVNNNVRENNEENIQTNNDNVGMIDNAVLDNIKNIALDLWYLMINVIKKPFSTAKEYVTSNDNIMAFILIALQGIFSGLLILTLISRIFSEVFGGAKNYATNAIDVNPFGNFMVGFLVSIALSFTYALIFFIISIVFKINVNYMTCVRIIAFKSVVIIFTTIITIVLSLMSAKIGIVTGLVIVPIIGFIFNLSAIKSLVSIDENKLVYFILLFVLISLIVYYIIAIKIGFVNIPLIRTAKNGLNGIASLLNNFKSSSSSISELFN